MSSSFCCYTTVGIIESAPHHEGALVAVPAVVLHLTKEQNVEMTGVLGVETETAGVRDRGAGTRGGLDRVTENGWGKSQSLIDSCKERFSVNAEHFSKKVDDMKKEYSFALLQFVSVKIGFDS